MHGKEAGADFRRKAQLAGLFALSAVSHGAF
jgi:hypothetical protein